MFLICCVLFVLDFRLIVVLVRWVICYLQVWLVVICDWVCLIWCFFDLLVMLSALWILYFQKSASVVCNVGCFVFSCLVRMIRLAVWFAWIGFGILMGCCVLSVLDVLVCLLALIFGFGCYLFWFYWWCWISVFVLDVSSCMIGLVCFVFRFNLS